MAAIHRCSFRIFFKAVVMYHIWYQPSSIFQAPRVTSSEKDRVSYHYCYIGCYIAVACKKRRKGRFCVSTHGNETYWQRRSKLTF